MAIVSQDQAVEELNEHLGALDTIIRGAWRDVESLPTSCHIVMTARSRASLVHDYILARASEYASSAENVRYFTRQLMHGLVVDGRYAIRFKKFDEDNRSRNQPTVQVTEFRGQIELDGIDATHHLEVGYITNALGTDIADVRIACPSGFGNAWAVSISDRGVETVLADLFPKDGGDGSSDVEEASIEPRKPLGEIIPFRKSE